VAEKLKVGIVGGGYAGMAAAVKLASSGVPVTVFESGRQLGGRARGVAHNGWEIDNGQHILLGCYRETLKLIEQTGGNIAQDFVRLPLQLTLHNRFTLRAANVPAPFHSLLGILCARGLSFGQKTAAARFMLQLKKTGFRLPQDATVLRLLQANHQDDTLIRLLWEPICISALNTPIALASAQIFLNVLRDSLNGAREDSDILLPRLDFSALFPARAAEYVRQRGGAVHPSHRVTAVSLGGHGAELTVEHGDARRTERFTHAICAAASYHAARLLRGIPALLPVASQLEALAYQPIYSVYLQYPENISLPHPMLGLDNCLTQWLFDKGRIAGQKGLIVAVISAEGIHQNLPHIELAAKVAEELRSRFHLPAAPLWHQVIAEKRATFSCVPNLVRPACRTAAPNLLLAGDYTAGDYPATLEGAVRSGLQCANDIVAHAK
jgi:squalene-associated FAD-dependent desaturase